jgi:hypothetical protein
MAAPTGPQGAGRGRAVRHQLGAQAREQHLQLRLALGIDGFVDFFEHLEDFERVVCRQRQGVQQGRLGAAQQQLTLRRVQQAGGRIEREGRRLGGSAGPHALPQRVHGGAQLLRRRGLGEVEVGAMAVAGELVFQRMPGREHDDADARLDAAQALGQSQAVFAGEVEVQHGNVGHKVRGHFVQRLGAVDA